MDLLTPPTENSVETGLIREVFVGEVQLNDRSAEGPRRIKAKVQEADAVNRNGRLYEKSLLEREINKMKAVIDERPGTVDHPEMYSASIDRLGILWTNVWMDGNEVWAEGNIIPTLAGKNLEAAIDAGVKVGISSRGYGTGKVETVNGQKVVVIQDDYELITFDAVTDPSVYTARVQKIESVDRSMSSDGHIHVNVSTGVDQATIKAIVTRIADDIMEKTMLVKTPKATEEVKEEIPEETPVENTDPKESEETPKEEESTEETTEEESTEEESTEEEADKSAELEAELAVSNERITTLEAELTEVREAAGDAAKAIDALVGLIGDELGTQDFYDVAELAYMAAYLKRKFSAEAASDDFEDKGKPNYDGFIESMRKILGKVSEQSVSAYIDSIVKDEKYADKLTSLLSTCKTKTEVDEKLAIAKLTLTAFAEEIEPAGKGTTTDPVQPVAMSRVEALAVKGRVANIISE